MIAVFTDGPTERAESVFETYNSNKEVTFFFIRWFNLDLHFKNAYKLKFTTSLFQNVIRIIVLQNYFSSLYKFVADNVMHVLICFI